ncbi:hypothetical protein RFI_24854, partial [Reticulomyxa filosa]
MDYLNRITKKILSEIGLKNELTVMTILQSSEVEDFTSKHKICLIEYLTGDATSNSAIGAVFEVPMQCEKKLLWIRVIQLYRQFDEPQVTFQDEISASRLKEFIKVERFALFNQISTANFQEYIERGIPIVWVALNGSDPQQLNAVSDTIQSIAKQWKGKISFVWIDNNKYGQRVEHLGILFICSCMQMIGKKKDRVIHTCITIELKKKKKGIKSIPGIIVTEDENIKYLFEGDLTNKNELQEWIAKYMNGHVERFFKSQDPPEINDDTVL